MAASLCSFCRKAFQPKNSQALYCSKRCQGKAQWSRKSVRIDRDQERARSRRNYRKAVAADPEKLRLRCKRHTEERQRFVRELKEMQPCADCGVRYPFYVMDFDHVRGEKKGEISERKLLMATLDVLIAEIDKCDVVCANCHRERTYQRRVHLQMPPGHDAMQVEGVLSTPRRALPAVTPAALSSETQVIDAEEVRS